MRSLAVWVASFALLGLERVGADLAGTRVGMSASASAVLWAGLLAGLAALATVEGVVAGLGWALGRRLPARAVRWGQGAVFAGLVVFPLLQVGQAIVAGDWVARQTWAPALGAAIPAAGAVLVLVVSVALLARLDRPAAGRVRVAALALVVALGALLADAFVLPGLYPVAHVALFAAGAIALLLAAGLALEPLVGRVAVPRRLAALAIALVALLGAAPAVLGSGLLPRSRANLILASPRTADLLPLVSPAPRLRVLRRELESLWHGVTIGRPVPPRGTFPARPAWNVILVTVDALRDDAVPPLRRGGIGRSTLVPFMTEWMQGAFRFRRAYAQASQTKRSLPPMFRSAEPFEDPTKVAVPLPDLMAQHGHVPVAVVPQYFLEPAAAESHVLLEGFERVSVYGNEKQEDLVGQTREVLRAVQSRPFFAWIHLYALHVPFYAGRNTTRADGNHRQRYRLALRWTDDTLRRLDGVFRELGLADRSVVVLGSDHGEPLGAHGRAGHGWTIYEPDIRVPLAIRVPGQRGAVVPAVVGNIDVVPTLLDLIGAPPHPDHRGHSLVPLLSNPRARWERAYYVRSGMGNVHGVVWGDDKLVWDREARLFVRFDVRGDPGEVQDLHDPRSPVDRALIRSLVRSNPALVGHELDDAAVNRLLVRRVGEIRETTPDDVRSFLLRLVALRPSPAALRAVEALFTRSRDPAIALDVVEHLFASHPRELGDLVGDRVRALAGRPGEAEFVAALAQRRVPQFRIGQVSDRLAQLSRAPSTAGWQPWLELVRRWRLPVASFGPTLSHMLVRADTEAPGLVPLVLADLAQLSGTGGISEPVPTLVVRFLGHPDLPVRLSAIAAASRVRGVDVAETVARRFRTPGLELRERQALLHAHAKLARREAVREIVAAGRDPFLTLDAVSALRTIGDPAALPFVEDVAKGPHPWYTKLRAKRAAETLRARGR